MTFNKRFTDLWCITTTMDLFLMLGPVDTCFRITTSFVFHRHETFEYSTFCFILISASFEGRKFCFKTLLHLNVCLTHSRSKTEKKKYIYLSFYIQKTQIYQKHKTDLTFTKNRHKQNYFWLLSLCSDAYLLSVHIVPTASTNINQSSCAQTFPKHSMYREVKCRTGQILIMLIMGRWCVLNQSKWVLISSNVLNVELMLPLRVFLSLQEWLHNYNVTLAVSTMRPCFDFSRFSRDEYDFKNKQPTSS
jgi:hypothetical protein